MMLHVLVLAPTRRAASETFIRANISGLPFRKTAAFGDERPLHRPLACLHGWAVLLSKALTRLGLLRLASLPAACTTRLLLWRHQPDVVLVDFGFHAVRVMEAAAWSATPLVVHFRGSDASSEAKFQRLSRRYRRLFQLTAGVIVKSRPMQAVLERLGADPATMLISPSGADPDLFQGALPAQAPPRFLAVGRLVAKKGPLQTLEAFARMRNSLPGSHRDAVRLEIIGDGPLRADLERAVGMWKLENQVELLGVQPQQAIAERMRRARGFVQHSMVAPDGDSEGNPVAVMEAQLSGLPVVATRHAGIPEVVRDGETGVLVSEGDVDGMAAAMRRLVLEPALAARLGSAGQRRVSEQFTVQHHWAAIAGLLERIVASPSPSL
ncbi:MAG: glycosyltransferase [Synechococcus sp.]|jgi:colanic acid/amylovoran biosynthesis glycosyltransferase|nr:glycosyltransferase [Synechococcus sp.]